MTFLTIHMGIQSDALLAKTVPTSGLTVSAAQREFSAYAPPMVWGPWVAVASHIGVVTYTIKYEAIGDTLVLGRVTYFKGPDGGQRVTEDFTVETTITTAYAVAMVEVRFKGIPLGSAVRGSISP